MDLDKAFAILEDLKNAIPADAADRELLATRGVICQLLMSMCELQVAGLLEHIVPYTKQRVDVNRRTN